MISRLLPRSSRLLHFVCASQSTSQLPFVHASLSYFSSARPFSTDGDGSGTSGNRVLWDLSKNHGGEFDPFIDSLDNGSVLPLTDEERRAAEAIDGMGEETAAVDPLRAWSLDDDKKEVDLFDIGDAAPDVRPAEYGVNESENREQFEALAKEENELLSILKGPNRAFGDLISASGITEAMLDSLIALKDFEGVQGLPPLSEIEEKRYEKSTKKSIRAEMERRKLEEAAKARVRKVDADGRAYGTGRRKCSVAQVWLQPGEGKITVNDKEFDVYFPMLDHRAALLLPFSETKTLGLWDVKCHVHGGGVSGQVGAIQLGISRALQNWEPDLRPPLRSGGYLTRDSRVVERKKPGKAKARKSFQWVKR